MMMHKMNLEGVSMEDAVMKLYLKLKIDGNTHCSVIDRNRSDVKKIENSLSIDNTIFRVEISLL